jgi:hypothetical protein
MLVSAGSVAPPGQPVQPKLLLTLALPCDQVRRPETVVTGRNRRLRRHLAPFPVRAAL